MVTVLLSHGRIDTTSVEQQGDWVVPDPEHVRMASFGFDSIVADYYWLVTVQLVGGDRGDTVRHSARIGRLIDIVTTLDPYVDHPYRFAAVWLTGNRDDVLTANRLLERGIAYHPLDWRNRYHLGFNHFFYLEDLVTAADHLHAAVPLEGSPHYLGALVARLRSSVGGIEIAAGFLQEMMRTSQDPYERASYAKALDEIETERRARVLDDARIEFWNRRNRDITEVADLVSGPDAPLAALPPAHPHFTEFRWVIDEETGKIESSYYGSRYELHIHPVDRAKIEQWKADQEKSDSDESEGKEEVRET